jgi:hypothetical protein
MEDEEFVLEVGKAAPWSLSVDEWRELGERTLDAADRMRESMGFRSGVESALISL